MRKLGCDSPDDHATGAGVNKKKLASEHNQGRRVHKHKVRKHRRRMA